MRAYLRTRLWSGARVRTRVRNVTACGGFAAAESRSLSKRRRPSVLRKRYEWVLTEYGPPAAGRTGSGFAQHSEEPARLGIFTATRKRAKDNAQTCQRQRATVPKTTRKRAPKTTRKRLWGRSFGSPRPRRCYQHALRLCGRVVRSMEHVCRTYLDAPLCSLRGSVVRQEEDESDEDENNTFWLASVGRLASVEPRTAARMRTLARANAQ